MPSRSDARAAIPFTRILALLVLVTLALTGCAAPAAHTEATEPNETAPVWPRLTAIDSANTNVAATAEVSDYERATHLVAPQFPDTPVLNDALQQAIETRAELFWDELAAMPTDDAALAPSLSGTWKINGFSNAIVGVELMTSEFQGANGSTEANTYWYSTERNSMLLLDDLIAPEQTEQFHAALGKALRATLPDTDDIDPVAEAQKVLDAEQSRFGFTDAGDLLIGFNAYAIAPGKFGAPAVTLPWAEVNTWLTPIANQVREASVSPEPEAKPRPTVPAAPRSGNTDCNVEKCVALTFDDGPSPDNDPQLLQLLAERDAVATFFMLGSKVEAFPELVAQIAAAGNEIGNHSATHPSFTSLTEAQIRHELERTNAAIKEATGTAPVLMRPPYGATSKQVKSVIEGEGMTQVLWTVDTLDWQHRDPKQTLTHIQHDTQPSGIILMHDIHQTTIAAVADSIDWLQAQGYTLVTVSDLYHN